MMKKTKVSLAWQILLALVLGILLGSYLHYHAESRDWLISNLLTPAGDIFIHLIKMIVVPIVISTLIVGIAGVGDAKQLGRIGAKTIIYFEVITTVAIVLGSLWPTFSSRAPALICRSWRRSIFRNTKVRRRKCKATRTA
ncbi:Glutamate-aspartate carrier protein [Raoultella terrigena]|uniref:Glutamate-aspartate carrier protein n=1 Tax=Raoultella terrigena TaxID=577 RepID=A0A4V6YW55_RAOTE|nr:Glutamate-aspartate carrier protein [Raoultella terrigena]